MGTPTRTATVAILRIAAQATQAATAVDGTQVQDNDFLDDVYFAPAIDAVKLQVKKASRC